MLQPRIAFRLRKAAISPASTCLRCQQRTLNRQARIFNFSTARALRIPATPREPPSQPTQQPKDEEPEPDFVPKPLGRPIGFRQVPKPGENLGIRVKKTYTGTASERNLSKRKDIVEQWGQNYFRDFKNIRKYRSGKTFIANPRIFRKDVSLYFPNLHGETLAENEADTTNVLKGKVSVVKIYSSAWGEGQVRTFTGESENPKLHDVLAQHRHVAQVVDINVEENTAKAWLVALFQWRLRRQREKGDWGKYFVVKKGVSDQIRETIGMLNGRVGYVYLVDENCKIRWAGSADAEGTEKEDLTKGLMRLIEDRRDPVEERFARRASTATSNEEKEANVV